VFNIFLDDRNLYSEHFQSLKQPNISEKKISPVAESDNKKLPDHIQVPTVTKDNMEKINNYQINENDEEDNNMIDETVISEKKISPVAESNNEKLHDHMQVPTVTKDNIKKIKNYQINENDKEDNNNENFLKVMKSSPLKNHIDDENFFKFSGKMVSPVIIKKTNDAEINKANNGIYSEISVKTKGYQ